MPHPKRDASFEAKRPPRVISNDAVLSAVVSLLAIREGLFTQERAEAAGHNLSDVVKKAQNVLIAFMDDF